MVLGVFARTDSRPCAVWSPSMAISCACSPRPRGDPEEQSAAVPAAEASDISDTSILAFSFSPLSSGGGWTEKPRAPHAGGARDRADSDNRPWMACGPNPSARSEPSAKLRARIRGRVLFGYFLLHEQEKVTRPPGWRTEKHMDVSRFTQQRRRPNQEPTPFPPNPPLEGEG